MKRPSRIAVDWDSTLAVETWPGMGEWLPGAVDALRRLAEIYDEVVIFTLRVAPFEMDEETPRDPKDQFQAISGMLNEANIPHNVYVWMQPYKPPCAKFVDDRNVCFSGSWPSVMRQIEDDVPETEIAWAAGFYDGEGSTVLATRGENKHIRTLVAQKDRRLLKRFRGIVGLGKVYKPNAQGVSYWQSTGDQESRVVLEILWPYLGPAKREQAERALAGSTWRNGHKDQLLCRDPSHEVVQRRGGGRRCRTCQQIYNKNYRRKKAA